MVTSSVSVVIPTRNRWTLLSARALRSALGQEDVDVEVVVVDDGSTDETPARLADLRDPRVTALRGGEGGSGVAHARNLGIESAGGEWIAFLDDDDVWSPRKLRTQVDLASRTGAIAVYGGVVVLDVHWRAMHVARPEVATRDNLLLRNTIPAGSSNVVVRTDALREVGGLDERLTYVADWDLWLRLAAVGAIAVSPELLVGYVRAGGGMRFGGLSAVREMKYFASKHPDLRTDPARFLGWIALQDRRAGRGRAAAWTHLSAAVAFRRPRHALRAAAALVDARGTGSVRRALDSSGHVSSDLPEDAEWLDRFRDGP
jgi:glycosyltransferase involved in cell wall biosynthesis